MPIFAFADMTNLLGLRNAQAGPRAGYQAKITADACRRTGGTGACYTRRRARAVLQVLRRRRAETVLVTKNPFMARHIGLVPEAVNVLLVRLSSGIVGR